MNFGQLPPLVAQMDAIMKPSGLITISANGITSFIDQNNNKVFTSAMGTKPNDPCANRGICNSKDGSCKCFNTKGDANESSNGYGKPGQLGDCGFVTTSKGLAVASCPGEFPCSGQGVCNNNTYCAAVFYYIV